MRVWMMISKRVYKMKKVRSVTFFFFFVDQIAAKYRFSAR
jgi:hypothetical protein